MRGKVPVIGSGVPAAGITPAYAGKSSSDYSISNSSQDHPRLCGEKRKIKCFQKFNQGSPPPMRGKVLRENGSVYEIRITPAYAGKSWQKAFIEAVYRDHPRLCGEKKRRSFPSLEITGSPPPMRGKADDGSTGNPKGRITPAYAGKRIRRKILWFLSQDHPRLCGEKHCHSQN